MADYQQPIGEFMSMMLGDSESDNEAMDDNLEEEDDEENVQNYELEDDDFIVDQENTIHDVDVDMADFRLNVDSDMERDDVLNGFPVDDEPEDMEVINNEDWESLDEGSDQDNKRRALIKSLGKPKKCSLGEIHKVSFYVGQKYKTKQELKEKIDMHALETRRNLYFKKMTTKVLEHNVEGLSLYLINAKCIAQKSHLNARVKKSIHKCLLAVGQSMLLGQTLSLIGLLQPCMKHTVV